MVEAVVEGRGVTTNALSLSLLHPQLPWSKQWLKDEAGKAANLLPELSGVGAAGTGYNFGGGGGVDQTAFSASVTSQSETLYDSIGLGQQQPSVYSQSLTASLGAYTAGG